VATLAARARFTVYVPSEIATYLVANGHAMGFFTEGYIAHELANERVVAVPVADLAPLYRESALVQLERQSTLSPAAATMVRYIQERATQLGILYEALSGHS
jgi:DNA-binding transcriptional LysR family regulator